MVSLDRCDEKCNTLEDKFGRISIPNKIKDVNLKVLDMMKGKNESKTLIKHISCEWRCKFDGRKCNSEQKWNIDKCQCECKKPIKHYLCEKVYACSHIISACECYNTARLVNISKAAHARMV